MSSRILVSIGFILLLAAAFASPALAGGWAVITLDELPTDVVAGEPVEIGFMVRQHGVTPMSGIDPTITARSSGGEEFTVAAEAEGATGHYVAAVTFPSEGSWEWSIQAFTMDQPMPALVVSAPGTSAASEPVQDASFLPSLSSMWIVRGVLLGLALVGAAAAFQRRSRLAATTAALCLVIGVGTFLLGSPTSEAEAQGKSVPDASISQVEMGRQLFLAKGCITCHYNDRAAKRGDPYWTIEMGAPDLTNYSSHPDVLFIRLKDPASAKSDSKMPNLELKETEIEALIAFINSK